jgi:osomolarity two-component system, sensor histidine kinase NIK1
MQGNMWVESEVSKGSKFYFTITSQISVQSMEQTLAKMAPFANRCILFVDTVYDSTGVVDRITDLGLRPYVVHEVPEVADKSACPHIDTIVVDSLNVVRLISSDISDDIRNLPSDRLKTSENTNTCGTFRSSC